MKEAFIYTEKSLQARLAHAFFPDHPVAKGDIAESAWRDFLRNLVPSRYKVGSGFVIDVHGKKSQQIDCLIYDNFYTPTLWGKENHIYVPAESVHAVFEIKPKVNRKYLGAASKKINSVRMLHRTSAPYVGSGEEEPAKKLFPIIGGLLAAKTTWKDGIKSDHFLNAVKEQYEKDKVKIDVVLTASHGYADYFDSGFPPEVPPRRDADEGAATRGVFRLIKALLAQGTVPAIDLNYYEKNTF